jgi:hypothetical protein
MCIFHDVGERTSITTVWEQNFLTIAIFETPLNFSLVTILPIGRNNGRKGKYCITKKKKCNTCNCTAPAATNYLSLRNPRNGCQGHPPPCLSPPDRPRVTRLDSNDVRTRSIYSTISIDYINAQSGWSLKTEKIRLKWHVYTVKKTGRKLIRCLEFLSHQQFFSSVLYKIYVRHHCLFFKSHK